MNLNQKDLEKIIVIGDRLLIKPNLLDKTTKTGLILPPGIQEKESIQSGYVIKVGPGYPIPNMEADEPWKPQSEMIKYIPLQVQEGDLAVFLQKQAFEITFNAQKYYIVSQSSILMVLRDNFLD
jgi:co-chaperonin GroES (HSP10)